MIIYNIMVDRQEYADITCAWCSFRKAKEYIAKEIKRIELTFIGKVNYSWGEEIFCLDKNRKVLTITVAEYQLYND